MSAIARYVPPSVAAQMSSMASRLQTMREKAKDQTAKVVRTAECFGVGLGLGYVEGRYQRTELMGAPIAPLVGAVAHGVGFVMGGADAEHFHAAGDACVAVAGNNFGKTIGTDQRNKQGQQAGYRPLV